MKPVGYRLILQPDTVENTTKSGIITATPETQKREQTGCVRGTVLHVGTHCWENQEPWCGVGDRVIYARHSGLRLGDALDSPIAINDEDIVVVLEAGDE